MYTVRLKQSLIITFVVIATSLVSLYVYHYLYIDNIHNNVRQATHNRELLWKANDLQYYDELLTNSAENYILTSDTSWLSTYEDAYIKFNDLYENINHLHLESEIQDIFDNNDSITELLFNIEHSALEMMKSGDQEKALSYFKSSSYWQAKDVFHQRIVDYQNHYLIGQESNNKKIEEVFSAFERLNLVFLLFFIVIIFLLFILAKYVSKVYAQLKDTNDKLEDKNEEYRIINNELEEKNEELRITDETLKEKNDNLLAAEEELRSNLEDLHEKNEELRITDETLKERNDDLLAAEEELRSNLEELYAKNEELERSEDRFKFMSELISQGVLIHDKGIILDVNDSFCRLFKMDREDLINNSVFDLFGGGGNRAIFEEQLAKEGQTSFEVDVMDSTNTMISIHVQGKDVSYKNKTARVTVVMDISDRKNAERLLRESEERLRLAIKGTNDGLWDWNLTTNEVYFSDSWKEMLGYNDEDLCNEFVTWEKLMHPDDIERTNLKIDKLLKGDGDLYRTEFRLRHKSGRYLHILSRGYMIRDNKGTISRIIGTHQDLSHRYEAEERLRQQVDENLSLYEEYRTISEELHSKNDDLLAVEDELRANNKELHDKNLLLADSEERFKSLFEKSKSVMIILDSDSGKILEANNSACKFYGYTSEELLECYIHDINTLPDEEIERELKMAKEEERPYFTFKHKLKSGEIRDVDVFTSVINYSNKHYLYSIVIDRTETVKANNEIAKVNRRLYGLESIVHYEAKSINDLLDFTLQEIKEYTNSEIGLFYHYDKTKGLFLLNNWSESAMLSYEINSISQSDKLDCLTKAVSEKKTIIINDNRSEYPFIVNDHDKKAIHKSVTIPIIINNEVEAVVWIGSNTTEYTLFEMQQVSFLLETTWILVEKQKMQDLLKSKLHIS